MARPSKLTPALEKAILAAVARGMGYDRAAAACGIDRGTFRVWRECNPAFSIALEKAEAAGEDACLARIEQAGMSGVWKADAWLLERRYPERYGRRETVKVVNEQPVLREYIGVDVSALLGIAAPQSEHTMMVDGAVIDSDE
jgi:hypothetical protein